VNVARFEVRFGLKPDSTRRARLVHDGSTDKAQRDMRPLRTAYMRDRAQRTRCAREEA
jgi:hypothetical protein